MNFTCLRMKFTTDITLVYTTVYFKEDYHLFVQNPIFPSFFEVAKTSLVKMCT